MCIYIYIHIHEGIYIYIYIHTLEQSGALRAPSSSVPDSCRKSAQRAYLRSQAPDMEQETENMAPRAGEKPKLKFRPLKSNKNRSEIELEMEEREEKTGMSCFQIAKNRKELSRTFPGPCPGRPPDRGTPRAADSIDHRGGGTKAPGTWNPPGRRIP